MGTLAGSGTSIYMANRLISYRLGKLEELVRERSGAIERLYILEKDNAVIHEQIKELVGRVDYLSKGRN